MAWHMLIAVSHLAELEALSADKEVSQRTYTKETDTALACLKGILIRIALDKSWVAQQSDWTITLGILNVYQSMLPLKNCEDT